jgi:hypothetical protein
VRRDEAEAHVQQDPLGIAPDRVAIAAAALEDIRKNAPPPQAEVARLGAQICRGGIGHHAISVVETLNQRGRPFVRRSQKMVGACARHAAEQPYGVRHLYAVPDQGGVKPFDAMR